jgi:neutral ceramidase
MRKIKIILIILLFAVTIIAPQPVFAQTYFIGSGIYDITGPAGEIVMQGFAVSSQTTAGIHTRLRSRAFVIGDGTNRVVFVSTDLGMLFQMVKVKV